MWSRIQTTFGGAVEAIRSVMGSQYSQFISALKQGDALTALDCYNKKKAVRDAIKPNDPLGTENRGNTVLHYVAKLNLRTVYAELLDRGGKPEFKNDDRKNCLHLICQGPCEDQTLKEDMLHTTIEIGLVGMDVEHVLTEKDVDGNTVLHLAASAGLTGCVDLLVAHKADLSATNLHKKTPADVATEASHTEIATKLETKILFHNDQLVTSLEPDPDVLKEIANGPMGMRDHDIRSMKDQLLIETSHMLGVSLFTAEVLLRKHNWSKEDLLEAWMADPADVCEKAGVELPPELGVHNLDRGECASGGSVGELECGVCYLFSPPDVVVPCQHHFCTDCWKRYLEEKISAGEIENISCPEYGCYKLVPQGVIERVVSSDMVKKFLLYDIKAFVDSNPNIRWCPRPGCGQAVSLPTVEELPSPAPPVGDTYATVHCGNDHYFCWSCIKGPHDPCTCVQWRKWLDHVEEMKPRIGDTTAAEADEAASSKWLADRSKPCPKCSAPIEKSEGCNHMCCRKCKHDFCWVCLDNWKCHNSSTGGYFECNRYDAQKKATDILSQRRDMFYGDAKEWEAISRFLHYYERYREHLNSLSLEEPFLGKARDKMKQLEFVVQQLEPEGATGPEPLDMSFIEDAVRELLKCRRLLQATYPFAYYLTGKARRSRFELLQGALEQVTEMLAEVVARPHLRKPRSEIIRLTREARNKRTKLLETKDHLRDSPPPPLPRRRYSGQQFSLLRDSDNEDNFTSFQRILRRIDDVSHDRSHDRSADVSHNQGNEDNELLRALEISRQEFAADEQLKEDIERAMEVSMHVADEAPSIIDEEVWIPPVLGTVQHTDEPETTPGHTEDQSWLNRLDISNGEQLSWPILRLDSPPSHPHQSPSPPHPSTPSDNGDPVGEWGPVFDEDEDLKRAIELSLQPGGRGNDMMDIAGPQILPMDSNKVVEGSKVNTQTVHSLPPELRHLLETHRTGEQV